MDGLAGRRGAALHGLREQRAHAGEGVVPGLPGERRIDLRPPRRGRAGEVQHGGTGLREGGRVGRDRDAGEAPVVAHHVGDGRRDDGPARRQIFRGLGGADEAGRLVHREGHEADIPARQIGRQGLVSLAAEVMDVRQPRQSGRVDLHHGADHDELPVGAPQGHRMDEGEVHAFVDHPIEAEARMRDAGLVGRLLAPFGPGAPEVGDIDAGGEGMDVVVGGAPGLVEAMAAGEHDVGPLHQFGFQRFEAGRRMVEGGQLVHAVVDDGRGVDVAREAEHHRRVEPQDRPPAALKRQQAVQHVAQPRLPGRLVPPVGQARAERRDALLGKGVMLEVGPRMIAGDRLLEDEDPPILGEARHQVLRPLKHEVPPQVGKTDQRWRMTGGRVGGRAA